MSKRNIIILSVAIVIILGIAIYLMIDTDDSSTITEEESASQVTGNCQYNKMIFYYSNGCSWCSKVKEDASIQRLADLGVQTEQVETSVGPINHQFQGVPAFVVDDEVYTGYRTYDQLKTLLGCT